MQALSPLNRARAGLGKKADAKRGVEEAISLGHSFGELSMALQGAAGVAVHVGGAERAVDLAEQVLERHRSTGTAQHEAWVLLALARCQVGDVDGAMAAIESIDVDDFPFGQAGRALVRAMAGDVSAALADAAAVEEVRGASYFDVALARLAGVLAADRMGDAAESRRWLDLLGSLASSVGDVVFVSIAQALGDRAGHGSWWRADADVRLADGDRLRRRRVIFGRLAFLQLKRPYEGRSDCKNAAAGDRAHRRPVRPAAPRPLVPHRRGRAPVRPARRVRQQRSRRRRSGPVARRLAGGAAP